MEFGMIPFFIGALLDRIAFSYLLQVLHCNISAGGYQDHPTQTLLR